MKPLAIRAVAFVLCMAAALAAAAVLRPTHYLAKERPPIDLAAQVPTQFGDWREAKDLVPLQPNPELQSRLDALYTQVLARTYVNSQGQHVMLSIAYGSDQSSEATAVHRPEFCYGAQGFRVTTIGTDELALPDTRLPLQYLMTRQGSRVEPVSYWITLDNEATLPGIGRKLTQLRYGLQGMVADGMLVRVSTIARGDDTEHELALQRSFLTELYAALPQQVRSRYFGGPAAADVPQAPPPVAHKG